MTDIAPGYDDRVAAIDACDACEHLALPTPEEVYEGVMNSRIHVDGMVELPKIREFDLNGACKTRH